MTRTKTISLASAWLVAAALATVPIAAQQPDTPPATPLEALRRADAALRDALIAFVQDQVSTNAIFAGQYSALDTLTWDPVPLLQRWIVVPPEGISAPQNDFRIACINALRDCVDSASDELERTLAELADDVIEHGAVRQAALFALAQFGDRSRVDAMLEQARKQTAMEDTESRARGWTALADVHYNLREYDEAAKAHLEIVSMIEKGEYPLRTHLPTRYYNCGCSLALAGRTDEAFAHVEKALEAGKRTGSPLPLRLFKTDMDIASLREDPRFRPLLEKYFGIAGGLDERR